MFGVYIQNSKDARAEGKIFKIHQYVFKMFCDKKIQFLFIIYLDCFLTMRIEKYRKVRSHFLL